MGMFKTRTPSVLEYYGTQIQSAVQTLPIPIVYGAPRVGCNIIYGNGFNAVKQQTGKGGKGLLSGGKGQPTQYLYYATLITSICEGPIQNIIVIYQDSNVYFNLSGIQEVDPNTQIGKNGQPNFVPTNAQFFPGGDFQEPWSYIESHWPADARGYKDTCYIGLPNMQLDSTATPPQLNFVPRGLFSGTCPLNPATFSGSYTNNDGQFATSFNAGYVDADPAVCVSDFLTNPRYGAGFPASLIDPGIFSNVTAFEPTIGDNSLQTYCQAQGFGWSVIISNAESAGSIIDRWTKNLGVAVVWTGETLKFVPYWDSPSGSNPGWGADNPDGIQKKYFTPNVQPLINLTDDYFLQAQNPEEEPVTLDRVDPTDVYNLVRISFRDRANQFNDNMAEDTDEVGIELTGARVDNAQVGHEFSLMAYAQQSATIQLRRNLAVRRRVTFRLPPAFGFFDPMDINTVTSGTNFSAFPVRIQTIEEDDTGAFTVVAEEFPAGAGSPTAFAGSPTTPPPVFQTNVPAQSVNAPVIFEPPAQMLAAAGSPNSPTIVIGVSGSNGVFDPNWGGCDVYISTDNVAYSFFGRLSGASRQGVLTAPLPAYPGGNPDNTNILSVSLAESGGELQSTTLQNAQAGATLSVIVDADGCMEIFEYTTATLTGLNTYNLTGLYRGLFGTQPLAHLTGAQFLRVDAGVLEEVLPPQFIGQTVYAKLTSFNIYNMGEQELADTDVLVYTYTPTGAGIDPTSNSIWNAMITGAGIDLGTIDTQATANLDLNLGGFGTCAVIGGNVDLGVV